MKNYDKFFETLHKNSVKRRRMFSLLLVLSLFTTSGVVWLLRGVGITMANEPVCPLAEHAHSDECYDDVLVCGLEENDEHSHSDECYQHSLICDIPEHTHTPQCFSEIPLEDLKPQHDDALPIVNITSDESSQDTQDNYDDIDTDDEINDDAESAETSEEVLEGVADDVPAMLMGSGFDILAAPSTETDNPGTVPTIDNIARGIKFTLFDYGDNELEAENNNYDPTWDGNDWIHPRFDGTDVTRGWKNVGINSGKNPEQDILFLAYGTPAYEGTPWTSDDENNPHNVYQRITDDNGHIAPDKNNYSGDYNSPNGSGPISGNRPIQGIVNTTLTNGFPTIAGSGHSLDYLFNETETAYKKVYTDVNYFLQEESRNNVNYLVYDSNKNYAYFDTGTKNFTIYDTTFRLINDSHHYGTDIDPKTEKPYNAAEGGKTVDPNFKIGFFPFDQYNIEKRDPNYNTKNSPYNHHFGMTMEADFINTTSDPNKPVTFKYSGDDDMWVFLDGKLALDLGGIHEPASGMIDFTNGLVWTQDNYLGDLMEAGDNSIKNQVKEMLKITDEQWNALEKPIGNNTSDTSVDNQNRWKVQKLSDVLGTPDWNNTASHKHSIKMFYLERGGCYSNLAMEINLPTVKPLSIGKKVVDQNNNPVDYPDISNYQYTILEYNNDTKNWEEAAIDGITSYPITVQAGKTVYYNNISADRKFKIVENNVNTEVFSDVYINDNSHFELPRYSTMNIESKVNAINDINEYVFTNKLRDEKTNISVTKQWKDVNGVDITSSQADYPVKFKLYRHDSKAAPEQLEQIAINGSRTFVVKKDGDKWETRTFTNLPKRFGDHEYTYSVVEQNIPSGFKAAYSKDENGNITIVNTDNRKSDIYVKKDWHNGNSPVQLTLKRRYASYSNSQPTSLTVNLYDEGNNQIGTYSTNKVYVGGGIEFSIAAPGGVEYYPIDDSNLTRLVPDSLVFSREGDFFEVSNLAAGSNTVNLKVTSDSVEDNLMILHHSFTRGNNGWIVQGNPAPEGYDPNNPGDDQSKWYANIFSTSNNAYTKGDCLGIRQRTNNWNGMKLMLDNTKFKINKKYTFTAYIRSENDANFKMTFNDGLNLANNESYHPVSTKEITAGQWTKISGTVDIPSNVNPYGMFLLIETTNSLTNFKMDEFVAVEGEKDVSVNEDGVVSISNENYVLYEGLDNSNNFGMWRDYGEATHSFYNDDKSKYAIVNPKSNTNYSGIERDLKNLIPGNDYYFKIDFRKTDDPPKIKMTLRYKKTGTNDYTYVPIIETNNDFNSTGFKTYSTVVNIPENAIAETINVYIEAMSKDYVVPYGVSSFAVKDLNAPDIAGYTKSINQDTGAITYTANNDRYGINFDENSATNPLILGEYVIDNEWSRTITLGPDDTNNWKYHWDTDALGEEHSTNRIYQYWIEETDEKGQPFNSNDYVTVINGNDVASNTDDNPIVVSNTYVWYTLPATGGDGTVRFYVAAAVLIALGLFGGFAIVYRERRAH